MARRALLPGGTRITPQQLERIRERFVYELIWPSQEPQPHLEILYQRARGTLIAACFLEDESWAGRWAVPGSGSGGCGRTNGSPVFWRSAALWEPDRALRDSALELALADQERDVDRRMRLLAPAR
jgi:hypothetical protein